VAEEPERAAAWNGEVKIDQGWPLAEPLADAAALDYVR
jgi:hypothetical protein